jgi:hypothetical protein
MKTDGPIKVLEIKHFGFELDIYPPSRDKRSDTRE